MTELLLAAAAVAALACPLHALWRSRRGRGACCGTQEADQAAVVAARQRALDADIRSLAARRLGDGAGSN